MGMGIPCGGYMSVIVEPQMLSKTLLIRGMGGLTEILCQMASLLKVQGSCTYIRARERKIP